MRAVAFALLAAAVLGQKSALPPEALLLSRIRRATVENLDRMPNYVCVETIERSWRPAGSRRYEFGDRVALEVAHLGGTELYAWPGEDAFKEDNPARMIGIGATSTGEYADHLRSIFKTQAAVIKYAGEEKLDGVRAARYDFRVSELAAPLGLRIDNASGTSGRRGSFWADRNTYALLRLEVHADGIPPGLDLQSASTLVDYRRVRIGSREVMLPSRSEMRLTNLRGVEWRNTTAFAGCREYTGRSTITFGDRPPPVRRRLEPAQAPVIPAELPDGLEISLALDQAIEIGQAPIGAPIRGRLTEAAGEIPKGAIVTGRLRAVARAPGFEGASLLFEFDRIDLGDRRLAVALGVRVLVRGLRVPKGQRISWKTQRNQAAAAQEPQLPPEMVLLSDIRRAAVEDLDRMPNYVCVETIRRSSRKTGTGEYSAGDEVVLEVAHLGGKELYAWPGGGAFEEDNPARLIRTGATATGDYAGHLRSIFASGAAVITYSGEEDLGAVIAARYDFQVPGSAAPLELRVDDRSGTSGRRGRFWADRNTHALLRLEVDADGIPPGLGLQSASTVVDYGRVRIGARDVILPAHSEMHMITRKGVEWRNTTVFAGCREYTGSSTITF